MTKKLLYSFLLLFPVCVFAQRGETVTPLEGNTVLKKYYQAHPELATQQAQKPANRLFKSAPGRFPFVERFNYPGDTLKSAFWSTRLVKKQGRSVIFNALDQNNNPYTGGAFGKTDELKSAPINLYSSGWYLYIQFNYSTGTTWNSGDSLVLEALTPSGNYKTIWTSPNVAAGPTDKLIMLPLLDYVGANFDFRFTNYCAISAGNTDNFHLDYAVVNSLWELPVHENFLTIGSDSSIPAANLWFQAQTNIIPGSAVGLSYGNVAIFDAMDENGQVYGGSSGVSGYADTLMSQVINLNQFNVADSVYLRFFYKALPNAKATDSLMVEIKNNIGVWQRVWQAGNADTTVKSFIRQINFGRFRHSELQFRIIGKCSYTANDTMKFFVTAVNVGKKRGLPFLDDFSASHVYPDQDKWTSRHVYINNNFPINPPSYNVATFDGLDMRGDRYGQGRGFCDTLCSQPIDLSTYTAADTIVLSFWVEPSGLGNPPNEGDSLVLEFRYNAADGNAFVPVWHGSIATYPTNKFSEIRIPVIDSVFLHDDFQFRFRNRGSLTGNILHWHVDYVRMDRGRTKATDYYNDIALSRVPVSLLKQYTSMPYKHFLTAPLNYMFPSQKITMKNNNNVSYAVDFYRDIADESGANIDAFTNVNPNLQATRDTTVAINDVYSLVGAYSGDSIVFNTTYMVNFAGSPRPIHNDNIPANDSVIIPTVFSNYLAYDDGSAEEGYAVKNVPGSVALGYNLPQQDTLVGIAIFFNQSSTDVSQKSFKFMVWKNVNLSGNGIGETVLKRTLPLSPQYQHQINGFYYYKFDAPLILPAGKFYIGWEQDQAFELNIGLDKNFTINDAYVINPELWYKVDDIWDQSIYAGTPMMRPLLYKWIDPPVGVEEQHQQATLEATVYPNPASDKIRISVLHAKSLQLSLYDISGKLVYSGTAGANEEVNLPPSLEGGLYFLNIADKDSGQKTNKKLLINK